MAKRVIRPTDYRVFWSVEDGEYVAKSLAYPGLSGLGDTEEDAVRELKIAEHGWLEWLDEDGV